MLLEVLAATACLCAAIPACLFHRNIRLYAPPPAPRPDTAPPAVAVLIPARNEAGTIRAAVEARAAQPARQAGSAGAGRSFDRRHGPDRA